MPEWLSFSLNLAAIGITIVFGVLSLIAVVISLIRKLDDRWQRHEHKEKQEAVDKEPSIDNITVVLISAAVATMVTGRYHIRSVRRLLPSGSVRGPWSAQGRAVLHGSHVVSKHR